MSKGNMYEFVYDTKNPICGACPHKCKYCYVENRKKRFPVIREKYSGKIRLDEKVLNKKLVSGKFYFIQSMGDLFAENVPDSMIYRVFDWCSKYLENTYLLQSKNPARFLNFLNTILLNKNIVLGTTIESNRDYKGMSKAPLIQERVKAMIELRKLGFRTMVTIEPVLNFDMGELVAMLGAMDPEWINLGADSGGNKLPEPSKEKLLELMDLIQYRKKRNLQRLLN